MLQDHRKVASREREIDNFGITGMITHTQSFKRDVGIRQSLHCLLIQKFRRRATLRFRDVTSIKFLGLRVGVYIWVVGIEFCCIFLQF